MTLEPKVPTSLSCHFSPTKAPGSSSLSQAKLPGNRHGPNGSSCGRLIWQSRFGNPALPPSSMTRLWVSSGRSLHQRYLVGLQQGCFHVGVRTQQFCVGVAMFRLDYISCLLTVISTVLVGRKLWQGWIIAGANSALICLIGIRTAQFGFVPANLFCIALYSYNLRSWKK
jgi:hypothetical protein